MMKKTLLLLLVSVLTLPACSQSSDNESYYKGIESYRDLQLTTEQIAQIKKLKKEIGPQFQAIGKDRSISEYEKGERKRILALKHRQDIESVLTKEQISKWESKHGEYTSLSDIRNNISDSYEDKLDKLEDQYKKEIDTIEKNSSISSNEKKARKEALKSKYKSEKELLKKEKKDAKDAIYK
ncbi:MAG: hypothetical protein ACK5M3_08975 [Dysgonomonas sp.]